MAPVRLGLIGLSAAGRPWAARAHLPYFQTSQLYQITALLNSSKASAEKAVKRYESELSDNVVAHGEIDSLVKDPNVDVVVVTVKVPEHYKLVMPALEAKKDVFVEWPLALTAKEAEEMVGLANSQNVKTMVGLQARQSPTIRKAKQMVRNGDLGDILGTRMVAFGGIGGPDVTEDREYTLPVETGVNLLTIPAAHAMDALCYVLGEFKDLQATLATNRPKIPVLDSAGNVIRTVDQTAPDALSIQGNLLNGGTATVVYHGGQPQTDKGFYWEIIGSKGSIVLEGPIGHPQIYQPSLKFSKAGQEVNFTEIEVEAASSASYNVGKAWDAYANNGDGTVTTFEDALVRHRMIDAIYRSNQKGTRETYI